MSTTASQEAEEAFPDEEAVAEEQPVPAQTEEADVTCFSLELWALDFMIIRPYSICMDWIYKGAAPT